MSRACGFVRPRRVPLRLIASAQTRVLGLPRLASADSFPYRWSFTR